MAAIGDSVVAVVRKQPRAIPLSNDNHEEINSWVSFPILWVWGSAWGPFGPPELRYEYFLLFYKRINMVYCIGIKSSHIPFIFKTRNLIDCWSNLIGVTYIHLSLTDSSLDPSITYPTRRLRGREVFFLKKIITQKLITGKWKLVVGTKFFIQDFLGTNISTFLNNFILVWYQRGVSDYTV